MLLVEQGERLAALLAAPGDLQSLYDRLLDDPERDPGDVDALGFAFGAMLLREDWLEWGKLIDDEDHELGFGVRVAGKHLGCAPLAMIRNRLDAHELWDLEELRAAMIHQLRQMGQAADEAMDE